MAKLTSSHNEELFRLERLRVVEDELSEQLDTEKISRLHDRNGVFYVDWAERPDSNEIAAVVKVWGNQENEPTINHFEMGVELVGAVTRYNPFATTNDTHGAAIEHLRAARDLLKKIGTRMKKSGAPRAAKRHFQSLRLAEGALRHSRRCQAIDIEERVELLRQTVPGRSSEIEG
jgi:hypothetical protein